MLIELTPRVCSVDIFAVIGTSIYREVDPRRFGSVGRSFFRLFSLMTLDDWATIWSDNREEADDLFYFLFFFIFFETFVLLKYV